MGGYQLSSRWKVYNAKQSTNRRSMTTGELICQLALSLQETENTVSDISVSKEGRIKFKVPVEKFKTGKKSEKCMISQNTEQFHVDTAGSIVVRKFLSDFLPVLQSLSEPDYNEKFILYNHLHFSIEPKNEFLEFTFHISFLHDLVLGDFLTKTESE